MVGKHHLFDHYSLVGNAYLDIGKIDEALANYKKAIEIDLNFAEAYHNLSKVVKFSSCSSYIDRMCEVYKSGKLMDRDKYHICFALGKAYGDIGEYEEAFSYLREGNALRKSLLNYDISDDQVLFNQIKDNFEKTKKFPSISSNKKITVTPIFILGMPRSGTTLVEQILSSHSNVTGAGELAQLARYGSKLATEASPIENASILNFREKYLSELSKLSNGKSIVTDKMPHNFRFIPLICAAFPEAKIVHVQRNAAATCWSNYKQHFASKNLGYCHDLNDIVEYYNLYTDIMKLWESHYSYQIYNLNYESLTTDPENQARKLIKYLGLRWQDACLSPHTNKRTIRTASQQQVRQKIYKGSSEAWRKYEPYLNGAFDSLPSF